MKRRDFIKLAGAASLAGCAGVTTSKARVVVVGGGFGGATAAKYIRLWDPAIEVVLVERASLFTSCPISNLVLAGAVRMDDIRQGYDGLKRHGVQVVNDEVVAIDAAKKVVRLERGGELSYDRLVVSPGVDFLYGEIEGYEAALKTGARLGPAELALADVAVVALEALFGHQLGTVVRRLAPALAMLARAIFAAIDGALGAAPDVLAHAAIELVLRL